MKVSNILGQKAGGGSVRTLAPTAKVTEALAMMAEHSIGTIVVSSDGTRAEGILSERDVVRRLSSDGAACLDAEIGALMTPNPVTCTPDASAEDVLGRMTEGRFRHMPVVEEDGRMVGLISIGDVVKAQLSELAMEKDALVDMISGR